MTSVCIDSLNIIGCGRAGRVLGALWQRCGVFEIGGVLNQSLGSGRKAVEQMGAGHAVATIDDMPDSRIWMVATPDHCIAEVCSALGKTGFNHSKNIVFHISGSLESTLLKDAGLVTAVASVHPLRSFAEFAVSKDNFAGTWCGFEGDAALRQLLGQAFEKIGGRMFDIPAGGKLLYHAGSVMVSNYMNALVESALQLYQLAGIDRQTASQLIAPIATNTVDNINAVGPASALTGPVLRGDWRVVESELEAIGSHSAELAELYRRLGSITFSMVESIGVLTEEQQRRLKQLLK